jgi:hypothetical protein
MEKLAPRRLTDGRKFRWVPLSLLSLLGIVAVVYSLVMPVELAAPDMNEASWLVPEPRPVGSDAAAKTLDSAEAVDVATKPGPTESSETATETLNSQGAAALATDPVPTNLATLRSLD